MAELYWLTDEQMARLGPYFPKSHGKPRVDDRRVLSGIIFVNRNGLRRNRVEIMFGRLKDWRRVANPIRPMPVFLSAHSPPGDGALLVMSPEPKGNISAKGRRILHVPGQENHAATRIDPSKGERWFCSAAEVRAAGWTAAVR